MNDLTIFLAFTIKPKLKQHQPDPIEAILFRMDQLNLKQKDLADIIGYKSRVSEVLNRKRKLNLSMIRKLSTTLNIPTSVLVQEY